MTMSLSVQGLQAAIGYLYLLSFCPPGRVWEFQLAGEPLRKGLAMQAGFSSPEYFNRVVPEACRRIVAFHQGSREPDPVQVAALIEAARGAHTGPVGAALFSARMDQLASLPARAKPDQRLRRTQGCRFCTAPCRYGFFALVTKPAYQGLQRLLESEQEQPAGEQDPVEAAWTFAIEHLWRSLGVKQGYITPTHLGHLAYCLLTLGTAKSRYPLPEEQYRAFQDANQARIHGWMQASRTG